MRTLKTSKCDPYSRVVFLKRSQSTPKSHLDDRGQSPYNLLEWRVTSVFQALLVEMLLTGWRNIRNLARRPKAK